MTRDKLYYTAGRRDTPSLGGGSPSSASSAMAWARGIVFYAILLPGSSEVGPTAKSFNGRIVDGAPPTACRPDRRRNVLSLDCQSAFYRVRY